MKVTQINPSLLVLKDNNISHFLFGLIFFAIGIYAMYIYLPAGSLLVVLGCGLLAILGLGYVVVTKVASITLDKETGKARFSSWSIIKRESRDFELGNIESVTLIKQYAHATKGPPRRCFFLMFNLKGKEKLDFEFGSLIGPIDVFTNSEEKIRNKAQSVAVFLNVPFKDVNPRIPASLIEKIKGLINPKQKNSGKKPN
jgi:hypothetical protein